MITFYRANITQTGCKCPAQSEKATTFYNETLTAPTLDCLWDRLAEHYGVKKLNRNPKRPVFQENLHGGPDPRIGFIRSFWNQDCSHHYSKPWWQIDWVSIEKVSIEAVAI